MTRQGWARVVLIAIVPVALAAACSPTGNTFNGADVAPTSTDHPQSAELYHSYASRYAAAVDPTNDGPLTPEQALTAYLAVPNVYGLRGKLFEPARAPRSYDHAQSVTTTTAVGSSSSPQWYARRDQKGHVVTVIRLDETSAGWSVTAVWGCIPGVEGSTQTTIAGTPTGTFPSGGT